MRSFASTPRCAGRALRRWPARADRRRRRSCTTTPLAARAYSCVRISSAHYRVDAQTGAAARPVRALAGAYEDMSRLFPASGYSDNALWQGALLAADAFWQFGDAVDRTTALRLFSSLTARFPTARSPRRSLRRPSGFRTPSLTIARRLAGAERAAARAASRRRPVSRRSRAALTGITREVLPEVAPYHVELGQEVAFYDERIDGPPRVFLDLQNTRAVET